MDKVGAVLVVGGGIGGMQASLDLADSGFKVYLLDHSPSIGGVMAQLDKTFPTNDCSMCIMAPKLVETGRHHNIELITNAEIEKVEGEAGHFEVTISEHPRRVNVEKCTGCGVCAELCPVRAIDEYNETLGNRAGIFVKYPQAVPLVYVIDKEKCIGCGICENRCKADAIEYDQGEETIEIDVGSIILCPGFDEFEATAKKEYGYGVYRNVVSSIEFERILSASGPYGGTVIRPSDGEIPEKVAFIQCVGSRDENTNRYCSSVCCMYAMKEAVIAQEHTAGVHCHIFFMDMRAFGKEFDDYYERAKEEHEIKFTRCRISSIEEDPDTKNLLLRYVEDGELKEGEFELVVLSVGLSPPVDAEKLSEKLGIELNKYNFCSTKLFSPLETSRKGIYVSGAFSSPKDIPDTVAQSSGAASKAASIISSERGKLVTVKEFPPEIAIEEGEEPRIGAFICKCGINIGGVVDVPSVVEYAKTLPGVVYSEWNLYTCSQDTQEKIKEKIKEHNLNRVVVASCTPRTHEPLFQNTCKEGGLNPYLFEMANIRDQCSWIHMHEPEGATKKAKDLVRMAIAKSRLLEPLEKSELGVIPVALIIGGGLSGMTAALDLSDQGYDVHLVEKEKELGGNLRHIYYTLDGEDPQEKLKGLIESVNINPKITVYRSADINNIEGYVGNFKTTITCNGAQHEIEHGIVIIATGAEEYKPDEYLYGKDERVLTQSELEERLIKGDIPKNVVMIQCVGSRNEERSYCSRMCCSVAVKNALKILELNPDANIQILYKDIRAYGFREDAYKEAAANGVVFIRYDEDKMPEVSKQNDRLEVKIYDSVSDRNLIINPDTLVLSTATIPNPNNEELAQMLKVPISKDGFFLEAHMKLRPVDFATEGVYLAGMAHWPKLIDESISQASGAAARAATILSKSKLEAEGIIASVNEEICDGCGICEPICEYKAIEIISEGSGEEETKKAKVNEALCKGCGACVGACPSGAMEQKGYKDNQLLAMIDAALEEVMI